MVCDGLTIGSALSTAQWSQVLHIDEVNLAGNTTFDRFGGRLA